MSEWQLNTPVAFIIFNRPDTTELVFAEIAKAKPPKLLVIADGPRSDRPGEAEKCAATRAIIQRVDWDCEVLTNYSEENLGCRNRVKSGLDWVFNEVPEAIILEDDCIAHPTFFRFCEELLERYREDDRVGMISGNNFQFGRKRTDTSYYFSRYNHIWGWASWRRAWQHNSEEAVSWPEFRDYGSLNVLFNKTSERKYWTKIFQAIHEGKINAWSYRWMLTCWSQGMVAILPGVNLVSNIGFGGDHTNTRRISVYAAMPNEPMAFPLQHPKIVLPHSASDAYSAKNLFTSSLWRRALRVLRVYLR